MMDRIQRDMFKSRAGWIIVFQDSFISCISSRLRWKELNGQACKDHPSQRKWNRLEIDHYRIQIL
ncbi:hypothetical protein DNTS_032850 [Danionella cerebrum]|uniref:Uncharacterized protein n=1 Tax=Danionella cerebrum TaxID=2873325 RepID=A0A553QTP8_9TELE|nr:hypothetical protein DNTS_032850 [Danionella translucida]